MIGVNCVKLRKSHPPKGQINSVEAKKIYLDHPHLKMDPYHHRVYYIILYIYIYI